MLLGLGPIPTHMQMLAEGLPTCTGDELLESLWECYSLQATHVWLRMCVAAFAVLLLVSTAMHLLLIRSLRVHTQEAGCRPADKKMLCAKIEAGGGFAKLDAFIYRRRKTSLLGTCSFRALCRRFHLHCPRYCLLIVLCCTLFFYVDMLTKRLPELDCIPPPNYTLPECWDGERLYDENIPPSDASTLEECCSADGASDAC